MDLKATLRQISVLMPAAPVCCIGSPGGTQYDEKNIRRRVYDALNVLIAMEIISRQKKEILWHGLPMGHAHGVERANTEKAKLTAEIEKKQEYLQVSALRHDMTASWHGCIESRKDSLQVSAMPASVAEMMKCSLSIPSPRETHQGEHLAKLLAGAPQLMQCYQGADEAALPLMLWQHRISCGAPSADRLASLT